MINVDASIKTTQVQTENNEPKPRRSRTAWAGLVEPPPIARYVGIDIGKTYEFCEVIDGTVTNRATVKDEAQLEKLLGPGTKRARIVFEACRPGWYLYDLFMGWGHEVWMADTTRARQMGIGQHKRKNDRIDAETLARAGESGRVPKAHVLSHDKQQLRALQQVRATLVDARARFVTAVRGHLSAQGLKGPSGETKTFVSKLEAMQLPASLRKTLEPIIAVLRELNPQIEQADKKLDARLKGDAIIELLRTAPGVGRIVAAAFVGVVDSPGRFARAHQLQSYLGLVPSENTSGKRKLGAITKQGNAYLRAMLVQAAWAVMRQRRSDPLKQWGKALAKRAGKRVAAVAVARRLAGILWAMWRDKSTYDRGALAGNSARGKRIEAYKTNSTAAQIAQTA